MNNAQYLLLMGACVLITLPLELLLGARVYRSPRRLLIALVPTFVVFTAWDLFGIFRRHWGYSDEFISGVYFGPIPLEELVFFVVIPICALLTYEGVGKVLALFRGTGSVSYSWRDGLTRKSRPEGGSDA